MKRIALLLIAATCLFNSKIMYSQVAMSGGKGLSKVLEAEPIKPTDIFVNSNFSAYTTKLNSKRLGHYYNLNINGTFGLTRYLEVVLNIVPYHEDQVNLFGRFGNTTLGLKYLTPLSSNVLKFGLYSYFKFPTADSSNVTYESFSTENSGWGVKALITADLIDIFPSFPVKWNLNIGYLDHDFHDQFFTSSIDQLFIGTGIKFSIRNFQAFLEYSGEIFFNNSSEVDFSQNSMRITPGIRFMGPWRNTVDFAVDIGLTSYDENKSKTLYHKIYPDWKLIFSVTHHFSVFKYFDKETKLEKKRQQEELRKLEKIRKKREKASQDLKRMKKILDGKKTTKKSI